VPIQVTNQSEMENLSLVLREAKFTPDLIVFDTLARVSVGKDENSARDMGQVVEALDLLRRKYSATILLLHHTRKGGDSERGSSALRGAADVMIECKASSYAEVLELKCTKMKDSQPFDTLELGLHKEELPNGHSSLTVGPTPNVLDRVAKGSTSSVEQDTIIQIVDQNVCGTNCSSGQLYAAFQARSCASKSTFFRALSAARAAGRIHATGSGKQTRYSSVSVSVK
jgi:AAA domain